MEKDGYQFDMKVHPPLKPVPSAMNHFVESILTDTPHIATGEEGLLVMQLLDAIYESAEKSQPVQII